MTNGIPAATSGYPAHIEPHLSDDEATRITHGEGQRELADFAAALGMQRPVSTEKVAFLLEHMLKEQMSADTDLVEAQMRTDGWEANLSDGETLQILAQRVIAYLRADDGIKLFNFFAKTFAKTSGSMFE